MTFHLKQTPKFVVALCLTALFSLNFLAAADGPDYDFEVSIHVLAPLGLPMYGDQSFMATLGPLDPDPPAETDPIEDGGPNGYPAYRVSAFYVAVKDQLSGRTLYFGVEKDVFAIHGEEGKTLAVVRTRTNKSKELILNAATIYDDFGQGWEFNLDQSITGLAAGMAPVHTAMAEIADPKLMAAAANALYIGDFSIGPQSMILSCDTYLARACATALRLASLDGHDAFVAARAVDHYQSTILYNFMLSNCTIYLDAQAW